MRIFHLATAEDWAAAQRSGRYVTATRDRTLAEVGFIHASRADQWQHARQRWYADIDEPLLLLVIETDLLTAPVIEEAAPPGSSRDATANGAARPEEPETFPHIYGALDLAAVVHVVELDPPATSASGPRAVTPTPPTSTVAGESFSRVYLREMFRQLLLACAVMAVVVAGSLIGLSVRPGWGPLVGAVLGLAAGLALSRVLAGRR